jgi:serine/threonine-protein kinase ULK/ATG1
MRRQQAKAAGVPQKALPEDVVHHFLKELAKGIKCLYDNNLIHRDLKPQNLLLTEDSPTAVLKIADFGFARHLAEASMAETLCGSPLYMAPEILKFQKYDAKADLWSVGAILYEMAVGKTPYGGQNHVQLLANIERNDLRFPKDVSISEECTNLLYGLLRRNPMVRISFDEFFNHPFARTNEKHNSKSNLEDQVSEMPTYVKKNSPGKLRSVSESNIQVNPPSPPQVLPPFGGINANTSPSRSGNIRPTRTLRAASSGSILLTHAAPSPRLSPNMSPNVVPNPSPRINPFKPLSESPPGAAALLNAPQGGSMYGYASSGPHLRASTSLQRSKAAVRRAGGQAMDSSGEYVLVETTAPNVTQRPVPIDTTRKTTMTTMQPSPLSLGAPNTSAPCNTSGSAMTRDQSEQIVEIMILRTQAIAPIAEYLWRMSAASTTRQSVVTLSTSNIASMFSLSSSESSSSDQALVTASSSLSSSSSEYALESKQGIFAAEALALYVKCMRLIQHAVMCLQQDCTNSKAVPVGSLSTTNEASRKVSLAYLTEQMTFFLERAEQCKKRINSVSALFSKEETSEKMLDTLTVSQDELLYNHALRLGKEGAVKEVLGQSSVAYELYLQAMLLLESILMDDGKGGGGSAMSFEDQKCISMLIAALEERIRNVQQQEQEEEDSAALAELQHQHQYLLQSPQSPTKTIQSTVSDEKRTNLYQVASH